MLLSENWRWKKCLVYWYHEYLDKTNILYMHTEWRIPLFKQMKQTESKIKPN